MISEKIIVGENTKYPLNGLLTLPEDIIKPVPAVVFVHGSGASNMDEKVGKITPFKDLAEGLATHGVASIRYDKRSYVHGLKMLKEKNVTVEIETIEDDPDHFECPNCDEECDACVSDFGENYFYCSNCGSYYDYEGNEFEPEEEE